VANLKADRDEKIPMLDAMLSRMNDPQRKSPAKTDYLNAILCQPEKLLNEAGTPLITMVNIASKHSQHRIAYKEHDQDTPG
jgi:hypothetical protein